MKRLVTFAVMLALTTAFGLLGALRASAPLVPSNIWLATSDMAAVRAGAAATLLPDGRVLITGGIDETGATLASAERYSPSGDAFLATPSMQAARANHTSTLLPDGRVLVAGGADAAGRALASTEIYDPAANSWSAGATLNVGRRGHTATALSDGRIVIAGGDDAGVATDSLEIYDPTANVCTYVQGHLSSARTQHAAALIAGDQVLIAGGNDGTNVLRSTDIYDARAGVLGAGPNLSTARSGLSATPLLDGRVMVAGGATAAGELATAEVFDPASGSFAATSSTMSAPRQNHLAILLPHNNQVLIVGGTAAGVAVGSAELYTPWDAGTVEAATGPDATTGTATITAHTITANNGTFCAVTVCASGYAGPAAPSVARAWPTGGALSFAANETIRTGPNDGLLLLAGGIGKKSAELYGFATIKTDKSDYAPGTTVTITGSGWQPGEWVALMMVEQPLLDTHPLLDVQADRNGNIVSTEFSPDAHDLNIRFSLTAFGSASQAQTTFTDAGAAMVAFATSGLPSNTSVTVSWSGTNNGGHPISGPTTFTSPGPTTGQAAVSTNPGSSFTFSFPANITTGGVTYKLSSTSPTSPFATGADQSTTTVTGTYAPAVAATTLAVSSASGSFGGSTILSATLSSGGSGVNGKGISFSLNGTVVGTANTQLTSGVNGVATLNNVSLSGINVGTYPTAITASFTADSSFGASSGSNSLTVNKATVTAVVAASNKPYDGGITATVTSCALSGVLPADATKVACTAAAATFADANVGTSKLVTATGIALGAGTSGDASGNYTLNGVTTATTHANITALTVTATVAASDKPYDGGTTATITSCTLSGVLPADATKVACTAAAATFADGAVGTNKVVTATGISLGAGTGGDASGNYTLNNVTTATTHANITAVTVTAAVTASSKPYDGTTSAAITSCTLSGVLPADATKIACAAAAATFADANVSTNKLVTATGISLGAGAGGNASGNYTLNNVTTATTHANITAVTVTAAVTASNKPYDGGTTATITSCTLTGVLPADATKVACAATAATFADANAGAGKLVTATGIAISAGTGGDASGNYTLNNVTTATTHANITAVTVTAAVTASNKPYDGGTTATITSCTLSGVLPADATKVACAATAATFADANAGAGKLVTATGIAISAGTGGDASGNYTLNNVTTATTHANITAVTVTAAVTASNKPYDGGTTATITSCTLTGVLPADATKVACAATAATFADANAGAGKLVTATGIAISAGTGGDASGNYTLNNVTTATTHANITAVTVTAAVTASNKPYDGGTTATITSCTLTGVLPADATRVACAATAATFADANAGAGKLVTATGIAISAGTGGDASGNYTLNNVTTATTHANITAVTVTAAVTASNKPYDGGTTATITSCTLSGVLPADATRVACAATAATFADANAGTAKLVTATGISLGAGAVGDASGNYTLNNVTTATTHANITAVTVAAAVTASNKPYDGGTTATITSCTLSGVLPADATRVACAATAATFADANAGTAKLVTATGISLGAGAVGDASGNYTLNNVTTATTHANITAVTVTAAVAASNKRYDGTTAASITSCTLSGVLPADATKVACTAAAATFADANVGTYKLVTATGISLSGGAGGDASGNYTLNNVTTATTHANITAVTVAAAVTASNRPYDGTTAASITSCALSGVLPADATRVACAAAAASFADANAGTAKLVTATGIALSAGTGGDASGNYTLNNLTTATTHANITALMVTAAITASDKTYDGTAIEPNSNMTCSVAGTLLAESANVTCTAINGSFNSALVGSANLVTATVTPLTGSAASNYTLGTSTTASANAKITPAPVTATAGSGSNIYDGASHAPSACAVTGLYTGTLTCTNSPTSVGPDAGTTTITPAVSGADLSNFAVTPVNGSYRIDKKQATAAATDGGGAYNGSAYSGSGTCSDNLTPALSYTPGPGGPVNVGTTSFTVTCGDGGHNYLDGIATGSIAITKAPVTATAGSGSNIYDGAVHAPAACAVTGLYTGTLTCTNSPASVGPAAGTTTITPTASGADLSNFAVTPISGSYTISRAGTMTSVAMMTPDPSVYDQPITLSAAVANVSTAAAVNEGIVSFTADASTPLCTTGTVAGGMASCTTGSLNLAVGSHNITATYVAGPDFLGGMSTPASHLVNARHTSVTIASTDISDFTTGSVAIDTTVHLQVTVSDDDLSGTPTTPSGVFAITSFIASDTFDPASEGSGSCVLSGSGHSASCSLIVTPVEADLHEVTASYPGDAVHVASTQKADMTVTAPLMSQKLCLDAPFNGTPIPAGSTVWFNAVFQTNGQKLTKLTHLTFYNQSIQIGDDAPMTVPDAVITFDPAATAARTSFDAVNNRWNTSLPTAINLAGKDWLSGMSVQVPSGLPASARVTWCGQFASDSSTLSLGWQWAAAVYSSNANFINLVQYDSSNPVYLNSDLNLVGVKAVDDNKADINYKNSDHAGTPEKYLPFVIGGARGGGGNNFTGGYSGSGNLK